MDYFRAFNVRKHGAKGKKKTTAAAAGDVDDGGDASGGDEADEDDDVLLALTEGALVKNLGLPIVLVCTKVDTMRSLEKEYDYRDAHVEYVQLALRKLCLEYGAALFYTSAKENVNCEAVFDYLAHRLYDFPWTGSEQILEKESILIPSGWDSKSRMGTLEENVRGSGVIDPDAAFGDVIPRPKSRRKANAAKKDVVAEDDQAFLKRQLDGGAAAAAAAAAPKATGNATFATGDSGVGKGKGKGKAPPMALAATADFFNNLLQSGSPGTPDRSSADLRTQVKKELVDLKAAKE